MIGTALRRADLRRIGIENEWHTGSRLEQGALKSILGFWIVKILATTLGETGGDAVTMSMNLGYEVGTLIFLGVFLLAVIAQVRASKFNPYLYWLTIVATTTVGTTMADFADRSLGIGYAGGCSILFTLLIASLAIWRWSEGSVSVNTVATPRVEAFYWTTILFSQTLGTAMGDWMADTNGLGFGGAALGIRGGDCGHRRALLFHQGLARGAVLGCFRP